MTSWKIRAEDEEKEWAEASAPVADSNIPKLTVETIDNHVYFYASVDSDRCLALIRTIRELDAKLRNEHASRSLPDDHPLTPIWLHVNSYGGYVFDGLSLADQLKKIETPVYSIVEGCAASAATLITMPCTRRYITPSSFMLIHQVSTFTWGTYEQLKDEMRVLDMIMARLTDFYKETTKLDEAQIVDMLKRDSWMNAGECLERGFVDEIL